MKPWLKILKIFLVWRLVLLFPVIAGMAFLNYGNSFPFFEISYLRTLPQVLDFPILKVWVNFDGVHYLNIASRGYIGEARFFPLFPILIYLFSLGNISFPLTLTTAILIPNIFFIAALVIFYKLLRLDYPEKVSSETILYLLVFPTAFFFVAVYTESLFLLLLLSSLYFSRKGNWTFSILSGILLISTRFVGILIIPALLCEYIIQNRTLKVKNYLQLASLLLITPLGLIAYSVYSYQKWGSFLYFLTAHSELGNSRSVSSLISPPQTLYRYFKIFITLPMVQFEWWIALFEVASFIFGCLMLYLAWKKKIRISYLIFGSLAFLMPVLSGTFSGLPRYLLVIFPIFIALALIKSKMVKLIYLVISTILVFILLTLFSRGYFVA